VKRRTFLLTSLSGVLRAPHAASAQTAGKIARVGILSPTPPPKPTQPISLAEELSRRLQERGWVEGKTLVLERRYADGRPDRLPGLAADLVAANVDVIVAVSPNAIRAARDATSAIPIVMSFSGDPIRDGFVASLARPGGTITGVAILAVDMAVKRLEVLKAALPRARRVAVLVNPKNPSNAEQLATLGTAGAALGLDLEPVEVKRAGDYTEASGLIARTRPDALLVASDPGFFRDGRTLAELAAQRRTPACYEWREFVEMGGLMSYGPNIRDLVVRVSVFVDKILRGARPLDLPVEQPTTFELIVNLKTAKALGLTIPPSLLGRADQVIE